MLIKRPKEGIVRLSNMILYNPTVFQQSKSIVVTMLGLSSGISVRTWDLNPVILNE